MVKIMQEGERLMRQTYFDAQEEREWQSGDDQYHRDDRQEEGAQIRATGVVLC